MRANLKVLLALELFVCFAPAAVMLFLGLVFLPVSFIMEPRLDNLDGLAMVVGGACGMVGIFVVAAAFMSGRKPQLSTPVILILAAMGFASLLPLVIGSVDSFRWRLFGLLPIAAGVHVIYLARSLLFTAPPATQRHVDDV
jgi:hypothetical protein